MPIVPRRRPVPVPSALTVEPEVAPAPDADAAVVVPRKIKIRRKQVVPAPIDEPTNPVATLESPPDKKGRGHPPVQHQFKKGNKGGPGRPKGSKNQTTLLKERFEEKRPVRINGVERLATQREILVDIRFKQALEGKEKAMAHLLSEAARIFPANDDGNGFTAALPVTRAEQAILDQILSMTGLAPVLNGELPLTSGTLQEFLGDPDDEEAEQTA